MQSDPLGDFLMALSIILTALAGIAELCFVIRFAGY